MFKCNPPTRMHTHIHKLPIVAHDVVRTLQESDMLSHIKWSNCCWNSYITYCFGQVPLFPGVLEGSGQDAGIALLSSGCSGAQWTRDCVIFIDAIYIVEKNISKTDTQHLWKYKIKWWFILHRCLTRSCIHGHKTNHLPLAPSLYWKFPLTEANFPPFLANSWGVISFPFCNK